MSGVKVSRIVKILHLFFVDDILIMKKSTLEEWVEINSLLKLFFGASVLKVNPCKSTFHHSSIQGELLDKFKEAFSFNFADLAKGFRYFGCLLKEEN